MSDGLRPLLFQYLSPVACRDCIDIALQEFAALLKYSLTGATRAWRSLRAEEKSSWLSQDYKAELESAPDAWTSHLQSYGWHVQAPSSDCPPDVQEAIRNLLAAGILTKEQVSSVVQDLISKPSGATRASGQEAVASASDCERACCGADAHEGPRRVLATMLTGDDELSAGSAGHHSHMCLVVPRQMAFACRGAFCRRRGKK